MSLLTFLFEAVFISLTGVMAPGPVTAIAIGKGSESPHAGALVAIGHGIVEFPLMISILFGFGYFLGLYYVNATIALIGGLILLIMGAGMFKNSILPVEITSTGPTRSPIIAGVFLSLGNPYFLIWWATLGAVLILESVKFGMLIFFVFALVHWLCDFLWYYFLSILSFKGGKFFGKSYQRVVFAICGAFLFLFSGMFIYDALTTIPSTYFFSP